GRRDKRKEEGSARWSSAKTLRLLAAKAQATGFSVAPRRQPLYGLRSELASCASGRMARSAPTSLVHVHEGVSSGVLAGCSGKTTPLQLIANRACARSEEQDD